jgi:glycosyltransferase involved in cell wall biosynthesis
MSQGLPIIASPYGSLPEIISTDTGFIVQNQKELTETLKSPPRTFSPLVIRKYVEDNFTITKHTLAYLALYQKVIDGKNLNLNNPSYIFNNRAEDLLPF